VSDVLADPAITPGRKRAQAPVDVDRIDGQSVDLQLAQEVGYPTEFLLDAVQPGAQLGLVEGVVE